MTSQLLKLYRGLYYGKQYQHAWTVYRNGLLVLLLLMIHGPWWMRNFVVAHSSIYHDNKSGRIIRRLGSSACCLMKEGLMRLVASLAFFGWLGGWLVCLWHVNCRKNVYNFLLSGIARFVVTKFVVTLTPAPTRLLLSHIGDSNHNGR